jgi:hypothetical protein
VECSCVLVASSFQSVQRGLLPPSCMVGECLSDSAYVHAWPFVLEGCPEPCNRGTTKELVEAFVADGTPRNVNEVDQKRPGSFAVALSSDTAPGTNTITLCNTYFTDGIGRWACNDHAGKTKMWYA